MSLDVTFRGRTEPAIVGVTFESSRLTRVHVPAAVAPLFVMGLIDSRLVEDLRTLGCEVTEAGARQIQLRVVVGGHVLAALPLMVRAGPMPIRLEPAGPRPLMVLGLEFLSRFHECALRFRGEAATFSLGN